MSTTPPHPPQQLSPVKDSSTGDGRTDSPIISSPQQANPPELTVDEQMAVDSETTTADRPMTKTPEPQTQRDRANGHKGVAEQSPSTPGHLPPFDWDEFEARYEQALAEANQQEQELLAEFENLVKACILPPS
jgi:hypothetical protein